MSNNLMGRLKKLEEVKKATVTFVIVTMRRLPEGEFSSFGEGVAYLLADGEEVDLTELSEQIHYIMLLPDKNNEL